MKTYIYRTLFIGVLVSSYLTHSQIRPNNNRGEYLRFDEIKDLKKRSTGETEFEDFSFNWDNGFHTALNNQILLKLARKKAKRVWFKRQKKRVRENIEKKLGRNFDNYDQAKEALFLFSEKENIYRNSKPPINKYQSLRSDGYAISKGYLKELKLLQLRKIEISAGNIHNPKYGYLKANGMLLKDIKDLNTLNQKWDNIVIPLGSNINNTHYNTSIYQKLNNLGADFNKQIIALKNNYYNRFNQWEQLNLMQLLLNFEEYKRLSSCGVCLLPSSFYKFKELDKATSRVIETYAMNNRDKRTSIFDTTIDYYGGYGRYMQWIRSKRQEAINNLVNEVHTARFAAENLNNLLQYEPFKLIEIDCNQIVKWQSLAQHTPPQSIMNKVKNLQENHEALLGDWNIQYLESAGGTIVNMDYFAVNITTLPNNPSTGQQFTSQQFLDYFRRNINNFVLGTNFSPYCEISAICQQETNLWNSSNPLGAIIKLDIPINDGVVVCAEYTNNYWKFMTMEAPYDNSHPVSGTRQFGIEQNTNGSYNIYVRGIDRFQSNLQENVAYAIRLGNPFFDADNLWESFQEKTKTFINQNGGVSTKLTPIHNRPDWNAVKDVLEGRKPISDLGCN
jgi:hypothetical protein